MKKLLSVICLVVFSAAGLSAANNKIEGKIADVSEKLSQSYRKNRTINFKKAIAIADFENLGAAAKENSLGEAMAELFSAEFSQSTLFRVVERKNLGTIFQEQSLQLSGATDGGKAAEAGKLLDAQALLFGSVSEVGETFTITVKLTDVETGEVLAETISVPKEDLIETREYLLDMAYVQKMGVGITLNVMGITVCGNNSTFSPALGFENTGLQRQFGIEVRYRFTKWLMAGFGFDSIWGQLAYVPNQAWDVSTIAPLDPNNTGTGKFIVDAKGFDIPVMIYFNYNVTRRFNVFAGVGVAYEKITLLGYFEESSGGGGKGFGVNQYGPELSEEVVAGLFRVGAEFFVTPRLAISFQVGYDLAKMEPDFANQWHLISLQNNVGKEINMSGLFLRPSISFYF
ncbi:MAG: hypothetical protein CVV44_14245 [Spirochaetae bacterium HGW-Spirochaetae-1]|jgi:TolB-like protein|nr:MAG: hypothetical protein CVV44_14245 [Spirochaetae bacterium HGW-Spirochaetae-1]